MSECIDLYNQIKNQNLVAVCKLLLENGFYLGTDGKLKSEARVATNLPWVFARHDETRKCNLWHSVFFNVFGWLPSPCLDCWKVVIRPRSLADLFKVRDMQHEMELSSKCGIEVRESVHGLYGGDWYCDSLEQGKSILQEVIDDARALKIDAPVFLKRGCTEFEFKFGDSASWDDVVTESQRFMEKKLSNFIDTSERIAQPDVVKDSIYKRWIEFAFANGDPTYAQFTNGEPLYAPYRLYGSSMWTEQGA